MSSCNKTIALTCDFGQSKSTNRNHKYGKSITGVRGEGKVNDQKE